MLWAGKYSTLLLKKKNLDCCLLIFSIKICFLSPHLLFLFFISNLIYQWIWQCSLFLFKTSAFSVFLSSKMTFPFYPWGLVPGRNFPWLSLKNGWLLFLYSYRTLTITSLWDIDNKISVMQMLYCPTRCERLRTKNRHYINVWMSEMWTMQQSVSIHPWRVEGQEVIQVSFQFEVTHLITNMYSEQIITY